ncbi:hypothetical protein [Streptomyces sp. NPDC005283]|uniref:hypothetical protein n=1 Tax=Streptomyces sp. NPDC005283 TaxID=3156871 RepID=UPI003453EAE0
MPRHARPRGGHLPRVPLSNLGPPQGLEKRRAAAWAAGQQPDPREARITRLRDLNQRLTNKLARTHTELTQLKERHRLLLSNLAAKDDELQRLRRELSTCNNTLVSVSEVGQRDDAAGVVPLPRR